VEPLSALLEITANKLKDAFSEVYFLSVGVLFRRKGSRSGRDLGGSTPG
jgi:hypothetical protein